MDLPGAVPDAKAIYELVSKQGKVPAANAILLTNEQATKPAILGALRKIATASRPGDHVMFYFSGHGVSAQAPGGTQIGLPEDTGALLPYRETPWRLAEVNPEMLITGRADLRPIFLEMDRNEVSVLAVFDSCYSENLSRTHRTARDGSGIRAGGSLSSLAQLEARMLEGLAHVAGTRSGEWPYRNLIALSAAARNQKAFEASMGRQSFDGQPHGFFTNSLLEAISGKADIDHNGTLDYEELHKYVLEKVQSQQQNQTPQLRPLYPAPILKRPVLGVMKSASLARARHTGKLTVALPGPTVALRSIIDGVTDLQFEAHPGEADLVLKGTQSARKPNLWVNLRIESASEAVHEMFNTFNSEDAEDRNRMHAVFRRLLAIQRVLSLTRESSMKLSLQMNPPGRSLLFGGEQIEVQAILEKPARILLLSLAANGQIDVLWPVRPEDDKPSPPGKPIAICIEIAAPFGPETFFLAALSAPPSEWKNWAGQQRRVAEPTANDYEELTSLFSKTSGLKGFASLSSTSIGRNDAKIPVGGCLSNP